MRGWRGGIALRFEETLFSHTKSLADGRWSGRNSREAADMDGHDLMHNRDTGSPLASKTWLRGTASLFDYEGLSSATIGMARLQS